MAEENISVQHQKNVETAHFDVVNRILVVPVWKEMSSNLYDLFMGHEVGHAIWTPTEIEVLSDAISRSNKDFVNVVEDVRIEKNVKKKFPGLRPPFYRAYQELHEKNFFGIKDKNIRKLGLIDRINIYYKSSMTDVDIPGLFDTDEIDFVARAILTETFQDVADLAADIYNFLKQKQRSTESVTGGRPMEFSKQEESDDDQEDQQDSYEESDGDSDGDSSGSPVEEEQSESQEDTAQQSGQDDNEEGEGDSQSSAGQDDKGDQQSTEQSNEKSDNEDNDGKTGDTSGGKSGDEPFDAEKEFGSETDKTASSNMKDMIDKDAPEIKYLTLPDINLSDYVVDIDTISSAIDGVKNSYRGGNYGSGLMDATQLYQSVLKQNNSQISYLVKEFEMKKSAQEYASSYETKSGNINTSKIWSYKLSDDIFKRKNNIPTGKNHGMLMMIDWSGSMHQTIYQTVVQTIILSTFCKRVGIPFDVYLFTDRGPQTVVKKNAFLTEGEPIGRVKIDPSTALYHVLSSNTASSHRFKQQCNDFLFLAYATQNFYYLAANNKDIVDLQLGGTPLNNSLLIFDKVVSEFKRKNNVEKTSFIVLSDGDAGDGISYVERGGFMNEIRDYSFRRSYNKQFVFTDEKTGKISVLSTGKKTHNPESQYAQEFLLTNIKKNNHAASIGFFLCSGRYEIGNAVRQYVFRNEDNWVDSQRVSKAKRQMSKNGFITADGCGYDDYYLLDMRTQYARDDDLEIDSDMTNSKIAKNFAKFQSSKKTSRAMLNKFVDNIK